MDRMFDRMFSAKRFISFVILSLRLILVSSTFKCNISTLEFDALKSLFDATRGLQWYNQLNNDQQWSFPNTLDAPCSSPWYGLTCNSTNITSMCIITAIKLTGNSLSGFIPSEIGSFNELRALELDENYFFVSSIPTTLGQLLRLEILNLQISELSGVIPTQLGSMQSIRALDLSSNNLYGTIPTEFGNLLSLESLNLNYNLYINCTLPSEIGKLGRLVSFTIGLSSLHGSIPTEFAGLTSLRKLSLFSNSMTGRIPAFIGNFTDLDTLSLASSSISGPIPSELGRATKLVDLDLSLNKLSGPIPSELTDLRLLSKLSVAENSLTGPLPPTFGLLSLMTQINLGANLLTGSLNCSFENMHIVSNLAANNNYLTGPMMPSRAPYDFKRMVELDISLNFLSGPIVPAWGPKQVSLYLDNNFFSGPIPSDIGNLDALYLLYVQQNNITGWIPSELGLLSKADTIYLFENSISGPIPSQLCNLSSLSVLAVESNALTGTLPPCIGNLKSLNMLTTQLNSLSGSLPDSFLKASSLSYLDLHHNQFNGRLDAFRNLSSLEELYLQSNMFTGTIPPEIFNISKSVSSFDVSDNKLTGSIPDEFALYQYSYTFIVKKNHLKGGIPTVTWPGSVFSVSGNHLHGSIPDAIYSWTNLQSLDLSNNSLTGTIPAVLFNISSLRVLTLNNNKFVGNLTAIGNTSFVQSFAASNNSLVGPMLRTLGNRLENINLQSNQLSGHLDIDCTSATSLSTIFLGHNNFSGNLSTLTCLNNITVLSLENNQFTGVIDYVTSMGKVEQVILNNNRLSGTLPSSLSSMATLKALLVAGNKFTGHPDSAFNSSLQALLTAVDISSNDFTGPIPSRVFTLPNLESFASIKTCFSGELPTIICSCITLKVLLLDGVNSGLGCQRRFNVVHTSDAYVSTNGPVKGGIPPCFWQLPLLNSLHLSSNGLTGTIAELPLGSNLTSIVLSYNQLSGTIPFSLQSLPFTTLELASNRLKGLFGVPLKQNDAVVYLQNNRLSGLLPNSFDNASQVNVLQGNLFDCNKHHPKPQQDAHSAETVCGSSQLNESLLLWSCVIAVVAICTIIFTYNWPSRCFHRYFWPNLIVQSLKYTIQSLLEVISTLGHGSIAPVWPGQVAPPLEQYMNALQCFLSFQMSSFSFISIFLCIPGYLCLKFVADGRYSTHTYQYQWLVSATFLTGLPSAVFILIIWTLILLFLSRSVYKAHSMNERLDIAGVITLKASGVSTQSKAFLSDSTDFRTFRIAWCVVLVVIHISVMICVNVFYLYVTLSGKFSVEIMTLCQVAVAAWKVLWDLMVIPGTISFLRYRLDDWGSVDATLAYAILNFICSVFTALIIPFIVSLFVNSLCFLDIFVPQSVVNENFFYNLASKTTCIVLPIPAFNVTLPVPLPQPVVTPSVTECIDFSQVQQYSTEFYPPFTYSFQCGAGILTSYTPVLIYSFSFRILVTAVRQVRNLWVHGKPISLSKTSLPSRKESYLLTSMMLTTLVSLTFGLASPPLAAVLASSVLVDLYAFLLELEFKGTLRNENAVAIDTAIAERTREFPKSNDTRNDDGGVLNLQINFDTSVYAGLWRIPKTCLWVCIYLASLFWALLIFDLLGDGDVLCPSCASWGPVLVVCIPCSIHIAEAWSYRQDQQIQQMGCLDQPALAHRESAKMEDFNGSADYSIDSPSVSSRTTFQSRELWNDQGKKFGGAINPIRFPANDENSEFL